MKRRNDIYKNKGLNEYGDVKFADDVNKKYPLDTEKHIRAAWSYIHMARNSGKYDNKDLNTIEKRIISAWQEKINQQGPPKFHEEN